MVVQTRILIIDAGGKTYRFRVRIHRAETPADQLIESDFYLQYAKTIHTGIHHEMELVESPIWGRVDPNVPIHIHENAESKQKFVCFTGNIESLDAALSKLRTWCVGTVYSIVHNADFGPIAHKFGDDFTDQMRNTYRIVISGDMEELTSQ